VHEHTIFFDDVTRRERSGQRSTRDDQVAEIPQSEQIQAFKPVKRFMHNVCHHGHPIRSLPRLDELSAEAREFVLQQGEAVVLSPGCASLACEHIHRAQPTVCKEPAVTA
jgi:hypothetical protein